jgi:hypothetical protein
LTVISLYAILDCPQIAQKCSGARLSVMLPKAKHYNHGKVQMTDGTKPTNAARELLLARFMAAVEAMTTAKPTDDMAVHGPHGQSAPRPLVEAWWRAMEDLRIFDQMSRDAAKAHEPPPQDTAPLFVQLGKMLESTAKELSRKRRGRKGVDAVAFGNDAEGQPVKPNTAQMAKKLVGFMKALENEDRTMWITKGQFMAYGGEDWSHAFGRKVGLIASNMYLELHGVRPKKSRQDTNGFKNKVNAYPRGIIQQAYWLAVNEIRAKAGDGAVWFSITGGALEKSRDEAHREKSRAASAVWDFDSRRIDAAMDQALSARISENTARMRKGFVSSPEHKDYADVAESEYLLNIVKAEESGD